MNNEVKHITISVDLLTDISNEVARKHVLQLLKELQDWKDRGKSIQNYILIKEHLYIRATN